ncbi:MAG: polysaccharide deacetylase family protein [Phycisphaerae bacterium]
MPVGRLYRSIRAAASRRLRRHLALSLTEHQPTLIVLLYHQVASQSPDWLNRMGLCITPQTFDAHLQWCHRHFPFIALSDGINRLRAGTLDRTAIAITFDDGMTGVPLHAEPILARLDAPATLFVNRDFLHGRVQWIYQAAWLEANGHTQLLAQCLDQPRRDSQVPFLRGQADPATLAKRDRIGDLFHSKTNGHAPSLHFDETCLNRLASNRWDIGNHSCSHPRFSRTPARVQQTEIADNADYLKRFNNRVPLFALPFGRPDDFNTGTLQSATACGLEFITAYGGVNPAGRTGADIRRIPCDSVSADAFENHLIGNILGW